MNMGWWFYVQTGCANWLCKLVLQTGCANWLCKLVVQTLCANSMCKLVVQTGHANWSCSSPRALVESCTSAPGGLHQCSWSSSSSFFTLGLRTWGGGAKGWGYVACPHTLPHVPTPATSLHPCTRPDPLLCIQTPATCPHTLPPPMPHVPTPCHMPPHWPVCTTSLHDQFAWPVCT